jgi:hypothetical protein
VNASTFLFAYVAFIIAGLAAAITQDRFFKALERRQPGEIMADSAWSQEIRESPSRLPSIVFTVTRLRLRALARTWPYSEVERSRRSAVVSIALSLATFAWIVLGPIGWFVSSSVIGARLATRRSGLWFTRGRAPGSIGATSQSQATGQGISHAHTHDPVLGRRSCLRA